jgi:hypothetical protein
MQLLIQDRVAVEAVLAVAHNLTVEMADRA